MVNLKTGLFEPLDHLQPLRPDRINQHIGLGGLNQERSVANPGDADFRPWGTDYSKYVPLLIQALQDAHKRIDDLEEKLKSWH